MEIKKLYTISYLCLFLLGFGSTVMAQNSTVKGVVTAEMDNSPIPGANILVKGTTTGTISDFDGNFELQVAKGQTLVFTFIGYASKEVVFNGETTLNVKLDQDTKMLTDVVVVGYGSMKKSDLTGSVASVAGEVLERTSSNRPVEGLQGRVSGVSITKSSGTPGAGMKVRVRGVGSTNNSDPLYVIDGVPSGNDMEHIAPEDIKSIEILKDASATAIYGNKGANGVIIVTTKSGKAGEQTVFSYNSYMGVSELGHGIDMLDASQQAGLILEAAANDGTSLPTDLESRINFTLANNLKGNNWQDKVFQTGKQQNHNFSVRGGMKSDKTGGELTYNLSATYYQEEGILENTNFDKMLLNSRTEYKFNSRVTLGLQLNLFRKTNGNVPLGLYGGPIPLSLTTSPMDRGVNDAGEFVATTTAFGTNPMLVVDHQQYDKSNTTSFGLRTWLAVQLMEGLSFKTTVNIARGAGHTKVYRPSYFLNENFYRTDSELYESRSEFSSWTWINLFNYEKSFGEHKLIGTLGHEASYNFNDYFNGTGINVPTNSELQYLNLAKSYRAQLGAGPSQVGTESVFARAFYSYQNKYLITGTVRYDGSSKFSKDNRYGLFPSVGASWRLSEEGFIKNLNIFSNLKFRAGWGRVGNEASASGGSDVAQIGNYGMYYAFGDVASKGGTVVNIPTPNLRWEIVETSNIGLDMGFLNGDLAVTADYFIKDTKDMITRVSLPRYYPKNLPNDNIGTMRNTGFELSFNYRKTLGEVGFSVGGNLSYIQNEILSLNKSADAFYDGGEVSKLGSTTRTEAGYEIAYFYGYKTDGIIRTEEELAAYVGDDGVGGNRTAKIGDLRFVDTNGNGKIDADDRQYLGSGTPDFLYGFNFSADYKGFDVSANFAGVYGSEIVNAMGIFTLEVTDYFNARASRMDRFHPINNPSGTEPRVTLSNANNNTRFSDRYVEDGSFLRVKNVQIGYTLPTQITKKVKLNKVRVYVSGQNLYTFTKYTGFDPEVGDLKFDAKSGSESLGIGVDLGNYPQPRTYLMGVNLTF